MAFDVDLRAIYDFVSGTCSVCKESAMEVGAAPRAPGDVTGFGSFLIAGQAVTWVTDSIAPTLSGTK